MAVKIVHVHRYTYTTGMYNGLGGHYNYIGCDNPVINGTTYIYCGYDLHSDLAEGNVTTVDWDSAGEYSTILYTKRAQDIITSHQSSKVR